MHIILFDSSLVQIYFKVNVLRDNVKSQDCIGALDGTHVRVKVSKIGRAHV